MTDFTIPEIQTKRPNEKIRCAIDFSDRLASTEILAGTPTITPSSSGLSISSITISTAALTVFGATVSANQSLLFFASSGTANELYSLVLSTTTSLGQILEEKFGIQVLST